MRAVSGILILLATFIVAGGYAFNSEPIVPRKEQSLADLPIGELNLQEANVPLVLSRIAHKYEVPIGVEVSPKDDLLKDSKVTIQMSGGTLRDALNSLVRQYPLYTWSLTDGVINVFPRDESRDRLLKTLLETRLQGFSIKRNQAKAFSRQFPEASIRCIWS